MQTLYSIESMSNEIPAGEPLRMLQQNIEQSRFLFTYLVFCITEVARFAEKDAAKRAQKHLPSQHDLNINIKIAGNEIVWAVLENASFKKVMDHFKIKNLADDEVIRKLYQLLIASPEYTEYIQLPLREKKSEKKIIEFIFSNLMLPEEIFISDMEEKFMNWDDDGEVMIVLMNELLQKPDAFNFDDIAGKEKIDFAEELLQCVMDKKEYCLELIKPKLKNWDADRIASLDMILMQMGVCEFLYFETIPPKVTINEYIDLAKEYSTEQSGHFINGILDNIHKELAADNKIHKRNFKNSTL